MNDNTIVCDTFFGLIIATYEKAINAARAALLGSGCFKIEAYVHFPITQELWAHIGIEPLDVQCSISFTKSTVMKLSLFNFTMAGHSIRPKFYESWEGMKEDAKELSTVDVLQQCAIQKTCTPDMRMLQCPEAWLSLGVVNPEFVSKEEALRRVHVARWEHMMREFTTLELGIQAGIIAIGEDISTIFSAIEAKIGAELMNSLFGPPEERIPKVDFYNKHSEEDKNKFKLELLGQFEEILRIGKQELHKAKSDKDKSEAALTNVSVSEDDSDE
jgi:hypothetical protein